MKSLFAWAFLATSVCAIPQDPKIGNTLLGPIYSPSTNTSLQPWTDAKKNATNLINQILATGNSTYGRLDQNGTSFSAQVFSLYSNKSLFEFHFQAPTMNGSYTKGNLTENTIYRTGSLGKLLTVYNFLVDVGDKVFNDPISKYIPEFANAAKNFTNPLTQTNWDEVTVGSLAAQLSGIGRDFALEDLAGTTDSNIPDGYPPLLNEALSPCFSDDESLSPCSRAQFLQGVINHPPVYAPDSTPIYSNPAYAILGLAYQNITGKNITQGLNDLYVKRLGMTSTSMYYPGPQVDAIIPRNDSYAFFSGSLDIEAPAGNQYTSTKDLRLWGRAILNYTLLSGGATRRWMKPTSLTSQWRSVVGAPWEIYRLPIAVDTLHNASRIVDAYTKSGDLGQYSTIFALIPDYNIGISVLAAGDHPGASVPPISGALADIFTAAAEAAAKLEARRAFPGTFAAAYPLNSSITLTVDGGPGVRITRWISNATDFLSDNYAVFDDFRLYPTTLSHKYPNDPLTYYKYHMVTLPNGGEPFPNAPPFAGNDYWYDVDTQIYNNLATDAFVIGIDAAGLVQSVESQALRSVYKRVS